MGRPTAARPGPPAKATRAEVLVVRDSPVPRMVRVALVSGLFSLSCFTVLDLGALHGGADLLAHLEGTLSRPFRLLFAAVPLLLVPDLLANLRALGRRQRMVFDARLRAVRQGERHLAAFCDIESVAVETLPGPKRKPRYALAARLPGGQRFTIRESDRPEPVYAMAERVAGFVGVPLTR